MEKIKVLVANDHSTFYKGLYRLIEDVEDMEIGVKAADGEEIRSSDNPRITCAHRR